MSKTSKTVRYDMYINTIDTSGLAIPLSKKEFQRQIKYYTGEIAKIHEEYKKEIEELKEENPKYWRYSDIEGCIDDMQIEKTDHEKYRDTIYHNSWGNNNSIQGKDLQTWLYVEVIENEKRMEVMVC